MRLLQTETLQLHTFLGEDKPKYAILSHTWGDGEVIFQDLTSGTDWCLRHGSGPPKVLGACRIAKERGYEYIWIDTCCIDKTSSAELSEAINSMFQWYESAAVCLAFLSDVSGTDPMSMASSRWFRRGWTLQELIAPRQVDFYDRDWTLIGDKFSMAAFVSETTGIDEIVLRHGHLPEPAAQGHHFPVIYCSCRENIADLYAFRVHWLLDTFSAAQLFCWASRRETTRPEDASYSLFGLLKVNMPLIYGEGGEKAFLRLQHALLEDSNDHSVLAWQPTEAGPNLFGSWRTSTALAPSLGNFTNCNDIRSKWEVDCIPVYVGHRRPALFEISKDAITMELWMQALSPSQTLAILDCGVSGNDSLARPVVVLGNMDDGYSYVRLEDKADGVFIISPNNPDVVYKSDRSKVLCQYDPSRLVKRKVTILKRYRIRGQVSHFGRQVSPIYVAKIEENSPIGEGDKDEHPCVLEGHYPQIIDFRLDQTPSAAVALFHKPGYPRFVVLWKAGAPVFQLQTGGDDDGDDDSDAVPPTFVCRAMLATEALRVIGFSEEGAQSASEDAGQVVLHLMRGYIKLMFGFPQDEDRRPRLGGPRPMGDTDVLELPGRPARRVSVRIREGRFLDRVRAELEVRISEVDETGADEVTS